MTVAKRQVAGHSFSFDVGQNGRLVFGLLVSALAAAAAVYLAFDYRAYWRETEHRLSATAAIAAEHVQQVVAIVDLTLHSIDEDRLSDDIVISRPTQDLHEMMKRAQSLSPVLQGLGLTDAQGIVIASATMPVASRADLSDRDHFLVHRDNPKAGLFIGRPVIARPQNTVSFPVSRRAVLPDGSFAGVVAARVDPNVFRPFFSQLGTDTVSVMRPDGVFIARYPEVDLVNLAAAPQSLIQSQLRREGADTHGITTMRSPVDGIERLIAYRMLRQPTLAVVTGTEIETIHRDWLLRVYPFLGLTFGGLALIVVVALLVRRHSRSMSRALAETAAARATAEQLADVKGAFLANMSHEIRTPLGGMLGYADLLLKSRLDPQQVDWSVKLKSAGEQLLAVINDILDYSKLESGNFTIVPKPVPLESVVDEVRSMMAPQAAARGLELRNAFDPSLPRWIRLDPVRLKQILINLLSNAIKFTDRGVVAINVGRSERPGSAGALKIEVTDTGIGIAKDKIDTVFERFTQVETRAARGRGGTGLGLSISRRLAELMGGTLTLDSRLGIGTTVELTLPLEAVAEPPREAATTAAGNRTGRILLVDDLAMNLEIAGAMLRSQGHEVTTAMTGTDAVDAAIAGTFDVILLDIALPDIDGYEVAREIRKLEPPGQRTPIIALTANALPEHIAQAMDAGMDGHIAKPLDERTLAAQLAAVLATKPEELLRPKEAPLIDHQATDAIRRIVGAERLETIKATFWVTWAEFVAGLGADVLDRERLARDTHDMVSHAGNIGYRRLADVCREVSHCARQEEEAELRRLIERMREVAEATRIADRR